MPLRLPIKKNSDFTCSECEYEFSEQLLIQNIEHVSSDERAMGIENQYDFIVDVKCPECGHEWEVHGGVYEYPEGAINSIELMS